MSSLPLPIPEHASLQPCPYCGRPASVTVHQAARGQSVIYSFGCWREPTAFAPDPFWEDCLGPQSDWTADLDKVVRLWNSRA